MSFSSDPLFFAKQYLFLFNFSSLFAYPFSMGSSAMVEGAPGFGETFYPRFRGFLNRSPNILGFPLTPLPGLFLLSFLSVFSGKTRWPKDEKPVYIALPRPFPRDFFFLNLA